MVDDSRHIPQVPVDLSWADRLGAWKARWGIGRMHYTVEPGLYAVGNPTPGSVVLVTANYKMSFDALRSQLNGRDAWIMVLDTKGINVWCAAGKGTFGTDEIVNRVEATVLHDVVSHKKLVLPQLGAPGVSAHEVRSRTGFSVVYGPVRAEDLPAFLDAGMKATPEMRRVHFPMRDRVVLTPIELVGWGKYVLFAAVAFFLLAGLSRAGYSVALAVDRGLPAVVMLLAAWLAAVVLGPMLLPWLPGRAFSAKGVWIGLAMGAIAYFALPLPGILENWPTLAAWLLMLPVVTSFIVMNFTGASTYTSLSGVKREMRIAVPLQLVGAVLGLGLWLTGRFV